jgi:hypothetical protein
VSPRVHPRGFSAPSPDWAPPSHHGLLARAALLASANLTQFRDSRIRQKQVGECVGASARRAVQLYHACRGLGQVSISDLAAYTLGRLQEYAGVDPDTRPALEDIGSQPDLVLEGLRTMGLVRAEDWPGPGDPGFDENLVNAEPSPDALVRAYDCRGLQFHQVVYAQGGLRAAVADCLVRGCPVILALNSDPLQAYDGTSVITSFPSSGQDHMLAFLDASSADWARLDNWWDDPEDGVSWGDPSTDPHLDGTWRASWTALEQGACCVLAVDMAPLVGADTKGLSKGGVQ